MKIFPSPETYSAFISAWYHCSAVLQVAKWTCIKKDCADFTSADKPFSSLTKNISSNFCYSTIPPLFQSDQAVANSTADKATLFDALFSYNSTLDDSFINTLPPSFPSDPIPSQIFHLYKVFQLLSQIQVDKADGSDGTTSCVVAVVSLS